MHPAAARNVRRGKSSATVRFLRDDAATKSSREPRRSAARERKRNIYGYTRGRKRKKGVECLGFPQKRGKKVSAVLLRQRKKTSSPGHLHRRKKKENHTRLESKKRETSSLSRERKRRLPLRNEEGRWRFGTVTGNPFSVPLANRKRKGTSSFTVEGGVKKIAGALLVLCLPFPSTREGEGG